MHKMVSTSYEMLSGRVTTLPLETSSNSQSLHTQSPQGAFYFFNDFPIRLKRHPIPGTIDLQKVPLISYLAGKNQQ